MLNYQEGVMAVIDITDVKKRKKKSISVNDVIPLEECNANYDNVLFLETPVVEGRVRYHEDNLVFDGSVKTLLSVPCSKCLKEIEISVDKPFLVVLVTEEEEYFMDFDSHCYEKDQLNLWDLVWVQIWDEIPFKLLCKDDCLGVCPTCGHNLNDGPCDCPEVEKPIDERMAKLRELLN